MLFGHFGEKLRKNCAESEFFMIKVCDVIMGSGKTQAAINYVNTHPDGKFIFIVQYLEEVERVKEACPDANLCEPRESKLYKYSKLKHTRNLIQSGKSIITTHALFGEYTADMVEMIRQHQYVLIMDEVVEVLRPTKGFESDIKILIDAGVLSYDADGKLQKGRNPYSESGILSHLYNLAVHNNLIKIEQQKKDDPIYYYWETPTDVLMAFKDVYILTYMFEGSDLWGYFQMNNITYKNIGISRSGDDYEFSEEGGYTPDYVRNLQDLVYVYKYSMYGYDKFPESVGPRSDLNKIGDKRTAFSFNWTQFDHSDFRLYRDYSR